ADSSAAKSDSSPQDARSRSIQKNGFDKDATGPGGENEDVMINGELIPPQVLAEIFSRIDNIVVLGYVCRRWNDVLSAPGFWIDCMTHRSMELPPVSLRSAKALNMKKVCLKEPFERNLIENPSGEKKLNGWSVTENGGDGVQIETPPISCTANLDEDIPIAFATSFAWCTMHCIIDLWKAGVEVSSLLIIVSVHIDSLVVVNKYCYLIRTHYIAVLTIQRTKYYRTSVSAIVFG
ncbi:unnamed protein product, partial [Anisakis simplex]|uniref:FBA domain-containing protein n=1 Tax=Anisakis simplex TaxID=6269 RepID=A0A0M3KEK6_ANISI